MAKKEKIIRDIEFVISEICRMSDLIRKTSLRSLSRDDAMYSIGNRLCGKAAYQRLWDIASEIAQIGKISNQVKLSTIRSALEHEIVSRFIQKNQQPNISLVDRAINAVISSARDKLQSVTHFVPCHLMSANEPSQIELGPVVFYSRRSFRFLLQRQLALMMWSEDLDMYSRQRRLLAKAIRYYRKFDWIAQVTISECDADTSLEVAHYATTAALDFLHLILGFQNTGKMQVGGVGLSIDRRARLEISQVGLLEPTISMANFGHLEYGKGWSTILSQDGVQNLKHLAGVALEAAVNPMMMRPISRRILDAAQWFGEACRERKASTRTIKYMTAVERMLSTGHSQDISKLLSERGAALCFSAEGNQESWRKKVADAYDDRSRLVHGSMSPNDPRVKGAAFRAAEVAQEILRCAIFAFGEKALKAPAVSEKRLKEWFQEIKELGERCEQSEYVKGHEDPAGDVSG